MPTTQRSNFFVAITKKVEKTSKHSPKLSFATYKKTQKLPGRTHTRKHFFVMDAMTLCWHALDVLNNFFALLLACLSAEYTTPTSPAHTLQSVLLYATTTRRWLALTYSRGREHDNIRQIFSWVYPSEDQQALPSVRTRGVSETTHWSRGHVWRSPISTLRVVKVQIVGHSVPPVRQTTWNTSEVLHPYVHDAGDMQSWGATECRTSI